MKLLLISLALTICPCSTSYSLSSADTFEFGINEGHVAFTTSGSIGLLEKTKKISVVVPECSDLRYVRVDINHINRIFGPPSVKFDWESRSVVIQYLPSQVSASQYTVSAKVVDGGCLSERACDELLENPLLRTPPPEPERPRPPRVRKPREFKLPPRFPLLSKDFYASWCNHQKELQMATHRVDDSPPELFPELYLKPRRLNYYARQLEENMNVNKELLKRINFIQRTGGFVDCWMVPAPSDTYNQLLCKQRQRVLNTMRKENLYFYSRLLIARSEQLLTKELEELWKDTKHKLILGASLPFILFKTEKIDRDIRDPAFDKPPNVNRTKISMDIWVVGGSKIGKVTAELFTDIVPKTCQLFMTLLKGDDRGHAYMGTRFFRVVPDLFCRGGDVTKDNGFGCYLPEGQVDPMPPESFKLKHTVPGVMSMAVTSDNEVSGQFNIIFKPLPQFDGKNVVFGRIVGGPSQALERISALGLPLGTTTSDCVIRHCGWFTRAGQYREGNPNTIKFPPRRKTKKE